MSTALHLHGVVLPDDSERDVWISDSRLSFEPVDGAETVVEQGFLLPGLVDAHNHPGLGPNGVVETLTEAAELATLDRDAGTLLIRDLGAPLDRRPLQERDDLPRLIRADKHIALPKRYIPGFGLELDDPALLPDVVAEQADAGDGWIKLVGDWIDRGVGDLAPLWPDDILAEAVRVAHDRGAKVTAHVFGEDALHGLVAAGIDCLEHATGLHSAGLVDEVARRGISIVPTLINIENFPGIADKATKYPTYAAHMRALHQGVKDMVRAAIDAGVTVYAGTDAGSMVAHGLIVEEITALRDAGLSTVDALAAASWRAREWLGFQGLTDGAHADVLAFDEDPRENLDALRRPSRIILRGAIVR